MWAASRLGLEAMRPPSPSPSAERRADSEFSGYQILMTGSIIANKGFIAQFGTQMSKGSLILSAQVLAIWGGVQSLGQGMGMLSTHL